MAENPKQQFEAEKRRMQEQMRHMQADASHNAQAMRAKVHDIPGQVKKNAGKGRSIFVLIMLIVMVFLILYFLSLFKR